MKYVSIDIETTGLDPATCQILEIAAVVDDFDHPEIPIKELPSIHFYIDHDQIMGDPYALMMNNRCIEAIAKKKGKIISKETAVTTLWNFFYEEKLFELGEKVWFAGKNFGAFDLQFLNRLPGWDYIKSHYRYFDLGNLYFHPKNGINGIPSLQQCVNLAGGEQVVQHTALDDAILGVWLLRQRFKPMKSAEDLAEIFHYTYEKLAPQFDYKTRKESAKPWSEVPEQNKKLMIAVCSEIMKRLGIA